MRLEADDGRPETSPPLRRGVQTADCAVVRERQAIPEDPPSWPDILRTIELGYSNARLEASDNRIKVTIRMAYGFHHANNPIALVMLRRGGLDIRPPQPRTQPTKTAEAPQLFNSTTKVTSRHTHADARMRARLQQRAVPAVRWQASVS